MIVIKPHHFIDIVKLYGSGIKDFVPDEKYHHSFYKVANEIVNNTEALLMFTVEGDDICSTCKCIGEDGQCNDGLLTIPGYDSKNLYNKMLDNKIIDELHLKLNKEYTASEYCRMIYDNKDMIFRVWNLENHEITERRYDLFLNGCRMYLGL